MKYTKMKAIYFQRIWEPLKKIHYDPESSEQKSWLLCAFCFSILLYIDIITPTGLITAN